MYFKHAFRKSYVGTKATQASVALTSAGVNNGLLTDAGVHSVELSNTAAPYQLGVGTYGFFNKDTFVSVNNASSEVTTGKPLVLAGASLMTNDKIGPHHGGYLQSNKSKEINPRYINGFWKTVSSQAQQSVVHIGNTNYNAPTIAISNAGVGVSNGTFTALTTTGGTGTGLTVNITVAGGVVTQAAIESYGTGYTTADVLTIPDQGGFSAATQPEVTLTIVDQCSFEFLCGENYALRIDLAGSPVLRLLNHDAYRELTYYGGCCPVDAIAPVAVDSTLAMIDWAKQIINDAFLKDFVRPIVYSETSRTPWFATAEEAVAAGYASTQIWDNYVSPGHVDGQLAGIRLAGAYVETKFGNCSFQVSDFYEREIVTINAALVNYGGDVCTFSDLCVTTEYAGFQGEGFGETILRDVVQDELYNQNFVAEDMRIREITQGDDIIASINRNAQYTRYIILHSVPRFNNNTSAYDNQQYALNIYVPASSATALETLMATWLGAVNSPVALEAFGHTPFVYAGI